MLMFFLRMVMLLTFAEADVAFARMSFATGMMALTNSTTQGGQGAKGSTLLTQTDITYHGSWWGAGLYVQHDRQGTSELDSAIGPRVEACLNPFYIEYGYALRMHRSFTDRAVAEQEGKGWVFGLGVRFGIGAPAGGGAVGGLQGGIAGPFMQFSYKFRTQTITEQDGTPLDEAITQTDGYPLFGLGFGF